MKLKYLTVLEYSKKLNISDYDNILKHLNPCSKFCNKDIDILQLPYSTIKYVQKLFLDLNDFNDICEIFVSLYEISKDDFFNSSVKDFYATNKYIKNQFELITKNENIIASSSTIDVQKWKASGGDRLDGFSAILGLNGICERYGLYPFDVANKPYSEVFYLQSMLKVYDEVNFNYNKND